MIAQAANIAGIISSDDKVEDIPMDQLNPVGPGDTVEPTKICVVKPTCQPPAKVARTQGDATAATHTEPIDVAQPSTSRGVNRGVERAWANTHPPAPETRMGIAQTSTASELGGTDLLITDVRHDMVWHTLPDGNQYFVLYQDFPNATNTA